MGIYRVLGHLAVAAAAGLQAAAAAAQVGLAWLDMPLDAEFSLPGTRRADPGLGGSAAVAVRLVR